MGLCDLVPGISGGTIALITGIYVRLMEAVRSFSPQIIAHTCRYIAHRNEATRNTFRQSIQSLDLPFLIPAGAGVATAVLLGSGVMSFLLNQHLVSTLAFFTGLILASTVIILMEIPGHKLSNVLLGAIGLCCGFYLSISVSMDITPSLPYIFFSGFLAVAAMFLPGISGSFILLILGTYEHMMDVLHDIPAHSLTFIIFIAGAGFGALTISRIIAYLFRKDKSDTLSFLLGLVLGCLTLPLIKIAGNISHSPATLPELIILAAAGVILVVLIGVLPHRMRAQK